MTTKPQTVLEFIGPIRRVNPGRAHGLKDGQMRVRGERGTESRLPRKRPPRSKRPYVHIPKDMSEPAIKTPKGHMRHEGITAPMSAPTIGRGGFIEERNKRK